MMGHLMSGHARMFSPFRAMQTTLSGRQLMMLISPATSNKRMQAGSLFILMATGNSTEPAVVLLDPESGNDGGPKDP
jgi:hypothetical protein